MAASFPRFECVEFFAVVELKQNVHRNNVYTLEALCNGIRRVT
jgi:hypothetical protein